MNLAVVLLLNVLLLSSAALYNNAEQQQILATSAAQAAPLVNSESTFNPVPQYLTTKQNLHPVCNEHNGMLGSGSATYSSASTLITVAANPWGDSEAQAAWAEEQLQRWKDKLAVLCDNLEKLKDGSQTVLVQKELAKLCKSSKTFAKAMPSPKVARQTVTLTPNHNHDIPFPDRICAR
jgi:hypothetical protein